MPIPVDFLQTADGDIDLTLGLRQTPDLATYVQQALTVNLQIFLGEWFLDTRLGLPVYRTIAGKRYDHALVETMYRQAVTKTRGVGSLDRILLEFDRPARTLAVSIECTTSEGDPVDPGPLLIDLA